MKLAAKFPVTLLVLTLVMLSTISCSKKSTAPPAKSSAYGLTTTFAGISNPGLTDTTGVTASFFNAPAGVAVDAAGNVYVADSGNNLIRKITPGGIITTIAGNGGKNSQNGLGVVAGFNNPTGIAIDAGGNLYIADSGNNMVRKIAASGLVSTLAGTGVAGINNGAGTQATFNNPFDITVDAAGNVYIGDTGNNVIRKISPAGMVVTFAGSGNLGKLDGQGILASFNSPQGLALDAAGNLYVADKANELIREISPSGLVSTFAGTGATGSVNGVLIASTFNGPNAIAFDSAGNMYITEGGSSLVRKITPGGVVTTLAGNGTIGFVNGIGNTVCFDGPSGIALDKSGNAYVADLGNNVIRKIVTTQ